MLVNSTHRDTIQLNFSLKECIWNSSAKRRQLFFKLWTLWVDLNMKIQVYIVSWSINNDWEDGFAPIYLPMLITATRMRIYTSMKRHVCDGDSNSVPGTYRTHWLNKCNLNTIIHKLIFAIPSMHVETKTRGRWVYTDIDSLKFINWDIFTWQFVVVRGLILSIDRATVVWIKIDGVPAVQFMVVRAVVVCVSTAKPNA